MAISLRLEQELESKLQNIARKLGISKSSVIRSALLNFIEGERERDSSYELGKDFFGKKGSGRSDLSKNRKIYLRSKLNEKYSSS